VSGKGGRGPRRKGNLAERAVVKFLRDRGVLADRVPLSGSAGGRYRGDVIIPVAGVDRRCEVKCRGDAFRRLYQWLDGNDLLIVRADRKEPLVILPLRLAAEIAAKAAPTGET
jgi:Holliday junction resolvase